MSVDRDKISISIIIFFSLLWQGKVLGMDQKILSESVILVHSYKMPPNIDDPWKNKDISKQTYLASVVTLKNSKEKFILTTAQAVKDTKRIELQKLGISKRYKAKIFFLDQEANLALLEVEDKKIIGLLTPLNLSSLQNKNTELNIVKRQGLSQLVNNIAYITNVDVFKSNTSAYKQTYYQVTSQSSNYKGGEPLILKGRLVGMVHYQDSNYIYVFPSSLIKHFLKDNHSTQKYRGFPTIGMELRPLISKKTRQAFGLKNIKNGSRVAFVYSSSPFHNVLQEDDVVTAINNHIVSYNSKVKHKKWHRVNYQYMTNLLYPGDFVELVFYRNGRKHNIKKPLIRHDSNRGLIRYYRFSTEEPFFIYGGFLFQELSFDYLKTWGSNWFFTAPSHFLYLWKYKNFRSYKNNRKVIISKVLADEYNKGYESYKNVIVYSINDTKIKNLFDVEKIINREIKSTSSNKFIKIKLAYGNGEILMDIRSLVKASKRIKINYGL